MSACYEIAGVERNVHFCKYSNVSIDAKRRAMEKQLIFFKNQTIIKLRR